jgi:hypothetical protein
MDPISLVTYQSTLANGSEPERKRYLKQTVSLIGRKPDVSATKNKKLDYAVLNETWPNRMTF